MSFLTERERREEQMGEIRACTERLSDLLEQAHEDGFEVIVRIRSNTGIPYKSIDECRVVEIVKSTYREEL